jgi:hypothetical protein
MIQDDDNFFAVMEMRKIKWIQTSQY